MYINEYITSPVSASVYETVNSTSPLTTRTLTEAKWSGFHAHNSIYKFIHLHHENEKKIQEEIKIAKNNCAICGAVDAYFMGDRSEWIAKADAALAPYNK